MECDLVIGQFYVKGLWIVFGYICWGIQNGFGIGCLMVELILDGEVKSVDIIEFELKKYKVQILDYFYFVFRILINI